MDPEDLREVISAIKCVAETAAFWRLRGEVHGRRRVSHFGYPQALEDGAGEQYAGLELVKRKQPKTRGPANRVGI
jgi:hypothetical protein